MTDNWIVSDAVRSCPSQFRPIAATAKPEVTIRVVGAAPRRRVFRGPSLFAAIETGRLAHRQVHRSTFPPIYSHTNGLVLWWDGHTTDMVSDAELKRHARRYLANIYDVPSRNVQILTASV